MIHKHFIAAVTALGLAISGISATTAQASDDTAKIITGAAALVIIGTAIAKHSKSKEYGYVASGHHGHKKSYYGHSHHKKNYFGRSGHKKKYYRHSSHKRYKYGKRHRHGYKYGHRRSKFYH